MRFVYLRAFLKEFISCLKVLSFKQFWTFATIHTGITVRVHKIVKANNEGQKAYIKNAKLEDNPYNNHELSDAWLNGYNSEKLQWKSNVPESLRKQA